MTLIHLSQSESCGSSTAFESWSHRHLLDASKRPPAENKAMRCGGRDIHVGTASRREYFSARVQGEVGMWGSNSGHSSPPPFPVPVGSSRCSSFLYCRAPCRSATSCTKLYGGRSLRVTSTSCQMCHRTAWYVLARSLLHERCCSWRRPAARSAPAKARRIACGLRQRDLARALGPTGTAMS